MSTSHNDSAALETRAGALLEAALGAGADAADAVAVRTIALSVEVRLGKVEESERAEADDFGLRVFVGRRSAIVSTNGYGDVRETAERAVAMARAAPEDRSAGLADSEQLARDVPDLDLADPVPPPDAGALTARALAAEEAARAVKGVSNSGGASASYGASTFVLLTSHGFRGSHSATRHGVSAVAIAGSGTSMERDYDYASARHLADLEDPAEIGRRAGERAARRLSPRKVPTGTFPVIYENRVAGGFLGHLAGAINGASVARGTSFLKDARGKPVFAPGIRIEDDPVRRRGLRSRPFDGEGLAAAPLAIVEDGVLTEFLLDCASARELGTVSNGRASRGTGSAPFPSATNLTLAPGPQPPEALLASVSRGLYVTDLIGHGVNLVTGDYSRGVSGFWIENGELAYPVAEITVAGNLRDMFARLVPASDLMLRTGIDAPTVLIEGLTVGGR